MYELAHYQYKANLTEDLLITLADIANNDPTPFIKKDCANLLMKAKKSIVEETIQNPLGLEERKKKTLKFIEIKENIEKVSLSEKSSD